ncbi:hypothetical protein F4859DRAFT_262137 [Xylaria cf. heliscus]|nr:hypothetical protein F4859DRAFT_262137 [Xylaria cf. heliscus]
MTESTWLGWVVTDGLQLACAPPCLASHMPTYLWCCRAELAVPSTYPTLPTYLPACLPPATYIPTYLLPTTYYLPIYLPTYLTYTQPTYLYATYLAPATALSTLFPFFRSERPLRLRFSSSNTRITLALSRRECLRWVSRAYTRHITSVYLDHTTHTIHTPRPLIPSDGVEAILNWLSLSHLSNITALPASTYRTAHLQTLLRLSVFWVWINLSPKVLL